MPELRVDAEGMMVPTIDWSQYGGASPVHREKGWEDRVAVFVIAGTLRILSSEENGSAAGIPVIIDGYLDARGLSGDEELRRIAGVGSAAGSVVEAVGTARQALNQGAPAQQGQARQRVRPDKLPDHLLTKLQKIEQYGANGVKQLRGAVTGEEGRAMAEKFVGPGFKTEPYGNGSYKLTFADGLRQVRGPAEKRGVNPVSGQLYSSTGVQMNFET